MPIDLTHAKDVAHRAAAEWGLELGDAFALARYSYVAPAGDDAVLKVAWDGDDESLHEAEALELWDGDGAVRLLRCDPGDARAARGACAPGDDISELPDDEAIAIAVDVAVGSGVRPARRSGWIGDHVPRWLDQAERERS